MPATAGRVRMPANNRVHSSAALQTHGIWQSAIGYDPYAPDQKRPPPSGAAGGTAAGDRDAAASHGPSSDQQNAYDSFQGLLALARLTGSNADEARGSCRRCGRVGHLPFQCRNFLVLKDEAALAAAAAASFPVFTDRDGGGAAHRKDKGHKKRRQEDGTGRGNDSGNTGSDLSCEDQSSDDEESGLSDSSEDSEMERAIAAKFGRNILKSSSHKSKLGHRKERSDATRHKKSHSKRIKSRKDASEDDDGSAEEEKTKAKHHVKSKRSLKNAPESDEQSRGSDSEVERKKKKRRHSHKRSTSKRQHSEKVSEGLSEGEDAERKKRGRRRWHKDRKRG